MPVTLTCPVQWIVNIHVGTVLVWGRTRSMVLKLLLKNQMANGIKITVVIKGSMTVINEWMSVTFLHRWKASLCPLQLNSVVPSRRSDNCFLLWLYAMPSITVLMLPVSASVTTNSTVINPFKYIGLNYLLTFSCVLSASDYKSPQYSFFTVYISIQDVQRDRRRCR